MQVLGPSEADAARCRLFGGFRVPGVVGWLTANGVESISPKALNDLIAAVLGDVTAGALGGTTLPFSKDPASNSLAAAEGQPAQEPGAGRQEVQGIDKVEADEAADVFEPPAPLAAGDILTGKVGDKDYRLCLRAVGDAGRLSAHVCAHTDGSWKQVSGVFFMDLQRMVDRAADLRWRVQMTFECRSAPPLSFEFGGTLHGTCATGKAGQFEVFRSRAGAMPELQWANAAETLEKLWAPCGQVLQEVLGMEQLKASIPQFKRWSEELTELHKKQQSIKPNPTALFVGASGCGKSRLINELLGAEVLPCAGEGSAVTAAPIEVRFRGPVRGQQSLFSMPLGETPIYEARFELFSEKEFVEMRTRMTRDLLDYYEQAEQEGVPTKRPPQEDHAAAARNAYDWFEAVYGTGAFKKPWPSAEDFRAGFRKIPALISQQALEERAKTPGELLRKLSQWLVNSAEKRETGQSWPLVRWATVWGPWECLRLGGLSFVDLPGFGDANGVRNAVAERVYSVADFVCVCSRIDRAATDRASLEWLSKVVRDKGPNKVAYVATKADQLSLNEVVRDNGLPQTATRAQAAQVRNEKIKQQVQQHVREAHSVSDICVHTVSARDFSRCVGRELEFPDTFLRAEATELPSLAANVIDSVLECKAGDRARMIDGIHTRLANMEVQLRERPGADCDAALLQRDFNALVEKLQDTLKVASEERQGELSDKQRQLTTNASGAVQEGKQSLPSLAKHWGCESQLHHSTYRALINNDGYHGRFDIGKDVAAPVVRNLDRYWNTNFSAIPSVAKALHGTIQGSVKRLVDDFADLLSTCPELKEHAKLLGDAMTEKLRCKLSEEVDSFERSLQEQQMGYAEDVTDVLRGEVATRLLGAQCESGPGSHARRKQSVTDSLPKVNLKASVAKPSERMKAVTKHFGRACSQMTSAATSEVTNCYAGFWEGQERRSQKERDAKAALRAGLQPEVRKIEDLVQRCRATMPRHAPSS